MLKTRRPGRPPGAVPRYKSIVADISKRFEAGEFPIGKAIPSCRQLASHYRTGVKTIWLALNELKREGRLQITPGRTAIATRSVPISSVMENAVAIVIKTSLGQLFGVDTRPGMGHGILRHLSQTRTTCLVLQDIRWWRYESPQGLRDVPIKGILIPGPFPTALMKQYEAIGVPIVLIDQPPGEFKVHAVTVDNYQSAFDATSRLIELGHQRIAFARSVTSNIKSIDPDAKERQEGFMAACDRAGLPRRQLGIFSATFGKQSAAIDDLLRASPRFTAAVCAADTHARQIHEAAKVEGIRIPGDLSVVTFRDPHPYTPDWSGPMIDFEEMGRMGTELLLSAPKKIQQLRVKTKWNDGETIGPVPR
jgi:DNA-binding transcriptional regulator YhcF (GntR family)